MYAMPFFSKTATWEVQPLKLSLVQNASFTFAVHLLACLGVKRQHEPPGYIGLCSSHCASCICSSTLGHGESPVIVMDRTDELEEKLQVVLQQLTASARRLTVMFIREPVVVAKATPVGELLADSVSGVVKPRPDVGTTRACVRR